MKLFLTGIDVRQELILSSYGSGTYTGTPTYLLSVSSSGNVVEPTSAQATALLDDLVGDSGSGGTAGLVPAPSAGDAAAGKYLHADGSWATVSASDYQVDQTPDNGTYGLLGGTVNGSNTTFTVSNGYYVSGTLTVYLNGQLQTQGASNDFQETTPASGTFDFNTAPQTNDIITAMYAVTTVAGSGTNITVLDEGSPLSANTQSIDFVGAGVVATNIGNAITVTISSGGDGNGIYTGSGTIGAAAVSTITSTSTYTIDWSDATDALLFTDSTKVLKYNGARLDIGGGTTAPTLRFWEPSGSGSNYVEFKATATTSDQTYTWPVAYPTTSGRALVSTNTGTMSWSALENWGDIWVVNTDGNVQVTADQNNDGLTYYSPDNSIRMVGDNAYGGFSDDAVSFRLAIDKLSNGLTSGTLATGDLFAVWDLDALENKYIPVSEMSSYFGGGSSIYTGSGTIASAVVATLTASSTFTIDYSGGTDAIVVTDTGTTVTLGGTAVNIGGAATTTELRFLEASGNGTEYTGFKSPDALGANQMYTLPSDSPVNNESLTWNTGGTLSWEPKISGPGTTVDGEIMLFNSTTGMVAKRATGTGLVTATSGVYGTVAAPTGTVVGTTDTQTLSNKRINPRHSSSTTITSLAVDPTNFDGYTLTALASGLTLTKSGTPINGQKFILGIKDNGTTRALTWTGTDFKGIGVTLPTTTVVSKWHYFGMIYNSTDTIWHVVAYNVEA